MSLPAEAVPEQPSWLQWTCRAGVEVWVQPTTSWRLNPASSGGFLAENRWGKRGWFGQGHSSSIKTAVPASIPRSLCAAEMVGSHLLLGVWQQSMGQMSSWALNPIPSENISVSRLGAALWAVLEKRAEVWIEHNGIPNLSTPSPVCTLQVACCRLQILN